MDSRFDSYLNETADMLCDALDGPGKTALDVETLVGGFLVLYEPSALSARPEDWAVPMLAMIARLEEIDSPRALTLLRGIAHLSAEPVASWAREAAADLEGRGHAVEPQFAALGTARPTEAWAISEPAGTTCVLVDFDYPGDRQHSFAVHLDPGRGHAVYGINIMLPLAGRQPEMWPEAEPIPLPTAERLLREALERSDPVRRCGHGLREYGAIVWSRLDLFGSDIPGSRDEMNAGGNQR